MAESERKINPVRIKQAEYERTIYRAVPESGTTMEELLNPAYWSHFASKLRPWDRVEIAAEDGTFYAELLVLSCGRQWAKMRAIQVVELTTGDVSMTEAARDSGFEVKWRGPHRKWAVIRLSDKQVLREEMQTSDEAALWLKEHLKATA